MYNRKDVEFVPFTEMTPEIYAKVKVGVKFEDLYKLGLRDEIEFVAGTESMPDMWYKFNEKTGEFDAYTHYEALIRWGLGLNMPAEAPEVVVPGTPVTTLEELMAVVSEGGEAVMESDLVVTEPVVVGAEVESILDLNGHKVVNEEPLYDTSKGNWSVVEVDGGKLVIEGDGEVSSPENDAYAACVKNGGELIIEGGVFNGNISAVYVHTGIARISGGEFKIQQTDDGKTEPYALLLNCLDENYKNGTANIIVTGGKFYNFNPADCKAEGANTNFVAEGYESIESEEDGMKVYTVQAVAE